jgi:hypothetical protein
MDKKKILPVLLAASIIVEEVVSVGHSETLALQPHTHFEIPDQPFATTVSPISASGGSNVAFDNEANSPAMPWTRWPQADDSLVAAAQRMLRLGDAY